MNATLPLMPNNKMLGDDEKDGRGRSRAPHPAYRGLERRTYHDGQDDRRQHVVLTEDQIEEIVDRAVEKAFLKVYTYVGRGTLNKLAWIVGLVVVGLLAWLAKTGNIQT